MLLLAFRGQVGQVKALEDTERTTTTDRDEMRRMVHDFYSTLFSASTAAPVPSWARQRWTRADLDPLPPILLGPAPENEAGQNVR